MHRSATTLLASLAVLAVPAAADAAPIPTYDYAVVIEGTADYNRADVDTETSAQHDETVDFRTTIPKLRFWGDVAEDSTGALGTATVRRGSYVISGPSAQVRCGSHEIADVTGGGLDATKQGDRTVFAVRTISSFTVRVGACDVMQPWDVPFTSGGDEVGVGIFDGAFSLPSSRIGEGSMTFPLSGKVSGTSCPMNHSLTVICSLTWNAKVTFTRIGEGEDDGEVVPVPIQPKPPAPPAPPTPPLVDEDLLVPLVAKAKLASSLTSAGLPIRCATACRGTLTATAGGRTLAKKAFTGRANRSTTVSVRFDAADRRAIRRAGGVRLTLRATGGGDAVKRTLALKVGR